MLITREDYKKRCEETGRLGIGGSHVAGLMCKDYKYSSPYKVWKEVLYGRNEDIFSKAARRGLKLEKYVADEFQERHPEYKVTDIEELFFDEDYPWMVAAVDRLLVNESETSLLEIKTTRESNIDEWTDNIPDNYYWQCIHYLNVTKFSKIIICCAIGFDDYVEYVLDSSEPQIQSDKTLLKETLVNFWTNHIETAIAPEIDGKNATKESIDSLAKNNVPAVTLESVKIDRIIDEIEGYKEKINYYTELSEQAKNKLRIAIGGYGKIVTDSYSISYKEYQSSSFKQKEFKEEHPELYTNYISQSNYTRLDIRKVKK